MRSFASLRMTAVLFFLLPFAAYATPPKLLVIVVLDQFRPDYFDQNHPYTDGFKRLRDNSIFFSNAHIRHVPTETAPGHATIVTGVPPSRHGIVGNNWLDTKDQKKINSTPFQLEVPTIGDELKKIHPESKVVALSFKERAAVILGGRTANIAVWFDWKSRKFVTSSTYPGSHAWLQQFNETVKSQIPWWPEIGSFLRSSAVDECLLEITKRAFGEYELGKDTIPDLLAVSFSATDNIGHRYGPDSPEMKAHLKKLDIVIGDLLRFLENQMGSDFELVLTSDHGVMPLPGSPEGNRINAQRIGKYTFQKSLDEAISTAFPRGTWVMRLSLPNVFFDHTKIDTLKIPMNNFLNKTAAALRRLPTVSEVYVPPQFSEPDAYAEIFKRSYFPDRSGDLMLRLKPGVLVSQEINGTSHGSPYDYDEAIPLLFYGLNFKPQYRTEAVSMEDIFPTCWDLLELGASPLSIDGKPLAIMTKKK